MSAELSHPKGRSAAPGSLAWGYLVSLGLAVALVLVLRRGALPLVPATEMLERIPLGGVVTYLGLWLLVLLLRSWRWSWLLSPLGSARHRLVLTVALVGHAALLVLPYRMGEAVRPALLGRYQPTGFFQVSGTVIAERVVDALVLGSLTLLGLGCAAVRPDLAERVGELPFPLRSIPGVVAVLTAIMALLALLLWIASASDRVGAWAQSKTSPSSAPWLRRFARALLDVWQGLQALRQWRLLCPFVIVTLAYWLVNALGLWLLLCISGFRDATFPMAIVIMGLLGLGIVLPTAPGYFGSFQLALYTALALYLPATRLLTVGAPFVFLAYLGQVGLTILVGAVALLLLPWASRSGTAPGRGGSALLGRGTSQPNPRVCAVEPPKTGPRNPP